MGELDPAGHDEHADASVSSLLTAAGPKRWSAGATSSARWRMGDAWDVAYAALSSSPTRPSTYLAELVVDGGLTVNFV
jgi:hypothetical protein